MSRNGWKMTQFILEPSIKLSPASSKTADFKKRYGCEKVYNLFGAQYIDKPPGVNFGNILYNATTVLLYKTTQFISKQVQILFSTYRLFFKLLKSVNV